MMLAATSLVVRAKREESSGATIAFAAVCVLGVLSHLQFIAFQGAMFIGCVFAHKQEDRRAQLRFQLPAAILSGAIALQQLQVLTWVPGPPSSWPRVLMSGFALAVGGGGGEITTALFAVIALASGVIGTVILRQRDCMMWRPAALVSFAIPALLVLVDRDQLAERFMLLPIVGIQLLFAIAAAEAIGRGGLTRAAGIAVLALFLASTALDLRDFFRFGRGDVRGAVAFIESRSNAPSIAVGSDQDFPAALSLGYYRSSAQRVRFVANDAWSRDPVDWLLIWRSSNQFQRGSGSPSPTFDHENLAALAAPPPPEKLSDREGRSFEFERVFPAHRLSGLDLFVYRRAP